MNEIIAKKLDEQLRVLGIYLSEYDKELSNDILGDTLQYDLADTLSRVRFKLKGFLNK